MADTRHKPDPTIEAEVIWAVIILYLFICGAMLGIHYFQPQGQPTQTSSMSPSHEHFRAGDSSDPASMDEPAARALLADRGYEEIRNLRLDDDGLYHATAARNGEDLTLAIDPADGVITERPVR